MSGPALRIQMFGAFRVWRGGDLIPEENWPTQKCKSLFKLLLIERGRSIPVDRILENLWPDLDPDRAQNNLWVTVSQVRRTLEPDLKPRETSQYILRSHEGYSFNTSSEYWLDVDEFQEAIETFRHASGGMERIRAGETMRELYQGEFLAEDPYEEWVLPARDQFKWDYQAVLDDLAEEYVLKGQFRKAISLCRENLAVDPAREEVIRRLMIYLYCNGEANAAVSAYEECRRILHEELGVEPEEETTSLLEQIQQHQLDANSRYPAPAEGTGLAGSDALSSFVGRAWEFDQIRNAINQLITGKGQVILIEGEPGIGKSRLAQEAIAYCRGVDIKTILVKCYQIEQTTPFEPLVELIDQIIKRWPQGILDQLAPQTRSEIAALAPEVLGDVALQPVSPSGADETRQARMYKALVQLLAAVAGQDGVFVTIDDIQWVDKATLSFLHYLARHIGEQAIMLVCTFRGEEVDEDDSLSAFMQEIKNEPLTRLIHLDRLSLDDVTRLAAAFLPQPIQAYDFSPWLYKETDGHPFYLVTILQSLVEQGGLNNQGAKGILSVETAQAADTRLTLPEALRESVLRRLRRVPGKARKVLDVAAVLGRRFEIASLQSVTQIETLELLDIVEDLLSRRLWRENEDGRHYDFSHDKIREVVYYELSQPHRAYLHREVAETLESRFAAQVDEYAGTLAEHYETAQVWNKAFQFHLQAADRSRNLFALHEAMRSYDRACAIALDHPDMIDEGMLVTLREHRGEARMQAGEFDAAIEDLQIALASRVQAGERDREAGLLIHLAMLYRRSDDLTQAKNYAEQALNNARVLEDERLEADALYHLGTVVWSQGDNYLAGRYHRQAVELCKRLKLDDLVAAQAIHGLGEVSWFAGQYHEANQYFNESMEIARRLGDKGLEDENLHNLGAIHTGLLGADYPKAVEYLRLALDLTLEMRLSWHAPPSLFILGQALAGIGDYEQALFYCLRSIEVAERFQSNRYLSVALQMRGCIYQDLNLYDLAEKDHRLGTDLATRTEILFWLANLKANLAIDRIRLGDLEVAEELHSALNLAYSLGQEMHAARCLEGLVELAFNTRAYQEASDYARKLLDLAQPRGMREYVAQAERWVGLISIELENFKRAKTALENALRMAEAIQKPRLLWDVHAAWASLYERMGIHEAQAHHKGIVTSIIKQISENLSDPQMKLGLPQVPSG